MERTESGTAYTPRPRGAFAEIVSARTWKATAYLLLTLVTGTYWFFVISFGLAFGIGGIPLWVGFPILLFTLVKSRWGARVERRLLRWAFEVEIPSPYRSFADAPLLRRLRLRASDPATWKDCLYLILLCPLGIVWFTVVVALWAWAAWLIAVPITYHFLPGGHWAIDTYVVVGTWWKSIVALLLGVLVALATPPVVRGIGRVHGRIAGSLLGASVKAEMKRRLLELEASREKAVWSAEAERRRIERDLHDGAQARLVALAMDLGRAREKLATDPQGAHLLVEHAHDEAKATIADLRNLARGIHPAVLTDRGLDPALSALAGRSPVPVRIDVRIGRPTPAFESMAYFVVAEALTNVAKYAHASEAEVTVAREADRLVVEVRDDGVGGARIIEDGGLAGLADRVASVDGRLTVSSPEGGPTVIRAELPCES